MVNAPSPLATAPGGAAAAGIAEAAAPEAKRTAPRRAAATAAPSGSGIASAIAQLLLDPATLSGLGRTSGTVLPAAGRTAVAGYAAAPRAATTRSSTSSSKSTLSFLSDPKLSVEDKLMRLLAYLSERWEKEMQSKMDQIAAGEGDTSGTGATTKTTRKKSTSILGKVASAVSGVVGGDTLKAVSSFLKLPGVTAILGKLSGPMLAAGASALGFPAAAPLLLQYGSKVVDVVAGVAGAAGTSSTATSSTTGMTDGKRQQLVMEVQRLYEKQKEMFGLVSNILRTSHDTRMTAVANIR